MKKLKRAIPLILMITITCAALPLTARADSAKVVTLGANLSEEQKNSMYEYFGTSADAVDTIEVTNADERKYMEGIATEAQIGTRTYSCSYVEPTTSGGIQVKVANLTFVTSSMIASTLLTSGMENCNVVAASPIEVSGTGALTGIMMAYETASGEELSEEQKEAAVEELVTTGDLADSVGQEDAAKLMNEVKQDVIEDDLTEEGEIEDSVNQAADDLNISLTDEQMAQIVSLMQTISQFDYDVNALKDTLNNLEGKSEGFFSNLWNSIKNFFTGGDSDGGIINDTNDAILGDSAVIDSTLDSVKDAVDEADSEGFWDKIVNFFKGLFGGDDADEEDSSQTTSDDTSSPDVDAAESQDADSAFGSDTAADEENSAPEDGSSDNASGDEAGAADDGTGAADDGQNGDSVNP